MRVTLSFFRAVSGGPSSLSPPSPRQLLQTHGGWGGVGVVVRTGQEGQKIETKGAETEKQGDVLTQHREGGRGREERAEREE